VLAGAKSTPRQREPLVTTKLDRLNDVLVKNQGFSFGNRELSEVCDFACRGEANPWLEGIQLR
jgi:hypothetical protein